VVAFVADLMVLARIEAACERLGFEVRDIASAESIAPDTELWAAKQTAEPVFGRDAILVDTLTQWQPALLLFDLSNAAVPWPNWIATLRSGPATKRIPIIAFGPHIDQAALELAADRGADLAVPRSRFMSAMPRLISENARVIDRTALESECAQGLSELAMRGLSAFNQGDYFEAHEHLEDAWNEEEGPTQELYRGILQVAVAYLQIQRGNFVGAVKMFLRARQWLEPLPEWCRGVNVGLLRVDAEAARLAVMELGPLRLNEFDPSVFRPVEFEDGRS
jgi:predicted metal-dependent hydrolase